MHLCLYISKDRDNAITAYPLESILAETSARFMNNKDIGMADIIYLLIFAIQNFVVEAGYREELVCCLLFLIAWDHAYNNQYNGNMLKGSYYSSSLTLDQFLETLIASKHYNIIQKQLKETFSPISKTSLVNARVQFIYFATVTYTSSK